MNHSELIARLHGLTGTLKSGAWSTIAEAADALQALERVPMTDAEVVDGFCKRPHNVQFVSVFSDGVRFAEAHHNITPPESK